MTCAELMPAGLLIAGQASVSRAEPTLVGIEPTVPIKPSRTGPDEDILGGGAVNAAAAESFEGETDWSERQAS